MQFKHMQEGVVSVRRQNIGELNLWGLEYGFGLLKKQDFMEKHFPLTFNKTSACLKM